MQASPYAPPSAAVRDLEPVDQSANEALRREHIRHEIQLKSVGTLYYFFGSMMALFATLMLISPEFAKGGTVETMAVYGLFLGVALLMLALGFGQRRLQPWVFWPTAILSAIGLLGVPIGTLINAWILYLLFCDKGRMVLSKTYQSVVAATPHVKYRRSVGDWIAISVLVLILLSIGVLIVIGTNA